LIDGTTYAYKRVDASAAIERIISIFVSIRRRRSIQQTVPPAASVADNSAAAAAAATMF